MQALPDPGRLLQEQRRLEPLPRLQPVAPPLSGPTRQPPAADAVRVPVNGFRIEDDTLALPREALLALLTPAIGQSLTLDELRDVVDRITQAYREQGYFLARAVLPPQDVTDGRILVRVQEGRLAEDGVRVQRDPATPASRARASLELARGIAAQPLTPNHPLRLAELERGLQLLQDLPGVSASGTLEPGEAPGETRLVIDLADQPLLRGQVGGDNHGSRYTQSKRVSALLALDNPSGLGDQASVLLVASPNRDYRYLSGRYSVLLNRDGLRAELSASHLGYRIGEDLVPLDASGRATTVGLTLRHPLQRSRTARLTAWAGVERKSLASDALNTNLAAKRVLLASAGLLAEQRTEAGHALQADATLALGHLDLSGNRLNALQDAAPQGPNTQGAFAKLMGGAAYQHALTPTLTLMGQVQGQWASANLDSAEKFILGGATGVRAYPSGEAAGDSGLRASTEARWMAWQLPEVGAAYFAAFADWGFFRQWRKPTGLSLTLPNSGHLAGAGLSATLLTPQGASASLSWARKIGSNPLAAPPDGRDSDGRQRASRWWLSAQLPF